MKIYQIKTKQKLPISSKEAWQFLSNPNNLAKITPKYMNFKILSGADRPIFAGQIIQYKVTPVLGITLKWVTEITHVKENEYFVDEQRFGPYSLWHHKHFIKENYWWYRNGRCCRLQNTFWNFRTNCSSIICKKQTKTNF